SLLAVAGGFGLAWLIYVKRAISTALFTQRFHGWVWVLERKYGFDQLYTWYVDRVQQRLIAHGCQLVERHIIIGFAVNGVAWLTQASGRLIRRCQSGVIQQYALAFVTGVVVLVYATVHR
ncbi:MAG: NADH-quinone oxidoreductase subunit L, partial [Candidatus Omnitrophica bacterium]|nr:NADH-quinone oxidoreductase subunit L [Candidatus Omnitrophota bacterium]